MHENRPLNRHSPSRLETSCHSVQEPDTDTLYRPPPSLAHRAPCAACEGRGYVKTPETVCYEIFREILRQTGQFDFQELLVLAHQDVIERLLDEESAALGELEVLTGKPIRLQTEALYLIDQYDVVLM